ncbi:hypothetical protein VUR80DRAFT_5087 [Thermomyces stellatus]
MSSPGSPAAAAGAPPQPTGDGPYPPRVASLGGQPTPSVDDPICGVFLFLFVCGAVLNMTIFQINRRRGHKFILSALCFGFCMARTVTCIMRIVWASRPNNVNIAIASNVFNAAGVLILFIVNLVLAQRLLRAYHPRFGWHRVVSYAYIFLYFSVIALLIMVITATVRSFFTLDPGILDICRKIQLFSGTYLAVLAFLPIPIVLLAATWPRRDRPENFGTGRLRTKVLLVLFTSTILAFGAGFRVGGNYDTRPINAPGWFHHKAAFYCVNFVIEVIVVYLYALMRFDRRFHIPNGSSAPGHYSGGVPKEEGIGGHINTEEAFGDDRSGTLQGYASERWEKRAANDLEKQNRGDPIQR